MNKGYISIYREMTEHWIWTCEKFSKAQAWIDILMSANHKEARVMTKHGLLDIKRGSFATSDKILAEKFGWDTKTVTRFLKLLEKDEMISLERNKKGTVISIINYDKFQSNKVDEEDKLNSCNDTGSGTSKGKPKDKKKDIHEVIHEVIPRDIPRVIHRGTNNNDNNDNNENNIIYTDDFEECWSFYNSRIGKRGNKQTGFKNFKELEFSKDEIQGAINNYYRHIKSENTENKYIKSAAYFFDKEYIKNYVVKGTKKIVAIPRREDF